MARPPAGRGPGPPAPRSPEWLGPGPAGAKRTGIASWWSWWIPSLRKGLEKEASLPTGRCRWEPEAAVVTAVLVGGCARREGPLKAAGGSSAGCRPPRLGSSERGSVPPFGFGPRGGLRRERTRVVRWGGWMVQSGKSSPGAIGPRRGTIDVCGAPVRRPGAAPPRLSAAARPPTDAHAAIDRSRGRWSLVGE